MSRFRRYQREIPEINTASLPDLVFSFLFFIMMVTQGRESKSTLTYKLPQTITEEKVNTKMLVPTFFLGYTKGSKGVSKKFSLYFNRKTYPISESLGADDKALKMAVNQYLSSFERGYVHRVRLFIDHQMPMIYVAQLENILNQMGVRDIIYVSLPRNKSFTPQ